MEEHGELYQDNELLYMYHQGEETALYLLLMKFEKHITTLIYRCIGRYQLKLSEREELMQIACIKLLQAIDTYREDKSTSFSHFYREIIKRAFVDHVRVLRKDASYYTTFREPEIREWDQLYLANCYLKTESAKEWQEEFWKMISKRERLILTLRMQGYTYAEIARCLGMSSRQVEYVLRKLRAKKKN